MVPYRKLQSSSETKQPQSFMKNMWLGSSSAEGSSGNAVAYELNMDQQRQTVVKTLYWCLERKTRLQNVHCNSYLLLSTGAASAEIV